MLGHSHPRSGDDNRDRRGNVERVQPVAAGAAHVQDFTGARRSVEFRLHGTLSQFAGECSNLIDGLTFLRECRKKIGFRLRRSFFRNELAHCLRDLRGRKRFLLFQLFL